MIMIRNQIYHLRDLIEYYHENKPDEYDAIALAYEEIDVLNDRLENS
jgi:hypothetical protein